MVTDKPATLPEAHNPATVVEAVTPLMVPPEMVVAPQSVHRIPTDVVATAAPAAGPPVMVTFVKFPEAPAKFTPVCELFVPVAAAEYVPLVTVGAAILPLVAETFRPIDVVA